jgi:fucose 4-O-acetylase-like acetyltransferase
LKTENLWKEEATLQFKARNNKIDMIKAFCIFSVICAHTTSENDTVGRILQLIGVCGVPLFFFFSSFLFYNGKQYDKSRNEFWRTKVSQIFIPWLLFGSITWIINNLFGTQVSSLSLHSYFMYMIGYKSHLYFMTILTIFFLLFRQRNKVIELMEKFGSVISIMAVVYVDCVGLSNLVVYPYLNPLFWIGYWSLGQILSKIDANKFDKHFPYLFTLNIVFTLIVWMFGRHYISYFSIWTMMLSILNILLSFLFSSSSSKSVENTIMTTVGKNTQFVYLTHIVVIGLLNLLLKNIWIYDFIKPIITWYIYAVLLELISMVMSKSDVIKNMMKFVGIRE